MAPLRFNRTVGLGLISGAIALWSGISAGWPGPRLQVWERNLEQQLLLLRGPRRPPARIVVVPIDDASLQQAAWFSQGGAAAQVPAWARGLDTLPWPRAAYGRLSQTLLQAGAAAVAINVVFEGPSSRGADDDRELKALLTPYRGRVVLAAEMLEPNDSRGFGALTLVQPDGLETALGGAAPLGLTNMLTATANRPLLHPEAYNGGVLARQGVTAPPSLALALLQQAGLHSHQNDARRGLNVYGGEGSLLRLPAWEVLDPERWRQHGLKSALKGALVLVGPVEGGRTSTPFGPLSGLELQATAVANSLQGDGLLSWPEQPLQRAALAVAPLLLALSRAGFRWRLTLVGGVLLLQILAAVIALQAANLWIPLLAPASALVALAVLYSGNAYLLEGRERQRLRRTFERYVAPSVVAEILSDPESAQGMLRGRVLEVTVLFSDLRGFTQLTRSRSLAGDSELHVRQLNSYLGAMVEVISAHGGTVDKFIGDAVMAVFGSPVGRGVEQEAQAAGRCALAMGERLRDLNIAWQTEGLEPLGSGIGLASGPVITGQIGSPQRMDFTVIGDTVNLASRLEGMTRSLDAQICCDAATAGLLAGAQDLTLQSFGLHAVRGIGEAEVFSITASEPTND